MECRGKKVHPLQHEIPLVEIRMSAKLSQYTSFSLYVIFVLLLKRKNTKKVTYIIVKVEI